LALQISMNAYEGEPMKHLIWTLAIALTVTGGVVPTAAAQDRTIGKRVDDATITATVKTRLVADHPSNLVKVNVDTRNGIVHLQGIVPTQDDRLEAERLARRTDGVVDVKNDLKVQASGDDSPRAPAASPRAR
jgi:hyperosmotically inducible periplasmic protein